MKTALLVRWTVRPISKLIHRINIPALAHPANSGTWASFTGPSRALVALAILAAASTAHAGNKPPVVCGLSGSVAERIESCTRYLKSIDSTGDIPAGWTLVTLLPSKARIVRDDETGRLWSGHSFEAMPHAAAAEFCSSLLAREGSFDAYPEKFVVPSVHDFRAAAAHKLTDAIWMEWQLYWSSTHWITDEEVWYFNALNDKTDHMNPATHHYFFTPKARVVCVSAPTTTQ